MSPTRRQLLGGGLVVAGATLLGGCRLPWSPPPRTMKVASIGFLGIGFGEGVNQRVVGLQAGLAEHGHVEGQNLRIEYRWAAGQNERLRSLAAELVALPVDVIVAANPPGAIAARDTTTTIPIVAVFEGDPVRQGLIASFAHPGGNVTGVSNMAAELSAKRLQLLKEVVPSAVRVGVLWNSTNPAMTARFRELGAAADILSVQLVPLSVERPEDFDAVLESANRDLPDALMVIADPFTSRYQRRILDFAAQSLLPAAYEDRGWVAGGGLMAYGPSLAGMGRRAAYYVDRILKGAKPADLPVEQPREFEFVVNLRTAEALGLTLPQHILLQATEVIR